MLSQRPAAWSWSQSWGSPAQGTPGPHPLGHLVPATLPSRSGQRGLLPIPPPQPFLAFCFLLPVSVRVGLGRKGSGWVHAPPLLDEALKLTEKGREGKGKERVGWAPAPTGPCGGKHYGLPAALLVQGWPTCSLLCIFVLFCFVASRLLSASKDLQRGRPCLSRLQAALPSHCPHLLPSDLRAVGAEQPEVASDQYPPGEATPGPCSGAAGNGAIVRHSQPSLRGGA